VIIHINVVNILLAVIMHKPDNEMLKLLSQNNKLGFISG
jgi:hypothetical protein